MAVNSNPPIQIDSSMDSGHKDAFINQNFNSIADSLNPYIISDGSNDRVFMGKDSAGNYVMKVSKSGYNAFDAANANLVFNSSQNVFKIVATGTYTLTKPANTTSKTDTVAHGLGFIPIILYNVENATFDSGNWRIGLVSNFNTATGVLDCIGSASVNGTNIIFVGLTPSSNGSYSSTVVFNYKYYLLQESSN